LFQKHQKHDDSKRRKNFSFRHFFHLDSVRNEHPGLDLITMQEFLQRQIFHNAKGDRIWPPRNRTNWDGRPKHIFQWLRHVAKIVSWNPDECLAAFPASSHRNDVHVLQRLAQDMAQYPPWEDYVGKPVAVNASTLQRLQENRAGRKQLCIYDAAYQQAPVLHFPTVGGKDGARLLVRNMKLSVSWL
jgi:hypothetical protein